MIANQFKIAFFTKSYKGLQIRSSTFDTSHPHAPVPLDRGGGGGVQNEILNDKFFHMADYAMKCTN